MQEAVGHNTDRLCYEVFLDDFLLMDTGMDIPVFPARHIVCVKIIVDKERGWGA